jgi:protoheme IX farnesyltransferase
MALPIEKEADSLIDSDDMASPRGLEFSGEAAASPSAAGKSSIAKSRLFGLISDYLSLTKPKVMVLLLITTVCPMILASGGQVGIELVLWTLLGGGLVSGSASAINCVWDQDIDRLMLRTQHRPLPSDRITPLSAVVFSLIIGMLGLGILGLMVNPLSATIALCGHLFYVFVYSMWLKRSTPQNIVIGGAAGAVPPMVGWVAVTAELTLTPWLLFLVIFLWTPPHFWALALNKNDDYRRAKVPMLPVVAGEQTTHLQMLCYAVSLAPVSLLLVLSDPHLGLFSLFSMCLLGVTFAYKTHQLRAMALAGANTEEKEKKAWDVFGFSLIYLALFFVCLVIDSTIL